MRLILDSWICFNISLSYSNIIIHQYKATNFLVIYVESRLHIDQCKTILKCIISKTVSYMGTGLHMNIASDKIINPPNNSPASTWNDNVVIIVPVDILT